MRELVVISGKGGTGKTTLVSSFAALADGTAVLADCDVDAANLHILLRPVIRSSKPLEASRSASINLNKCNRCGLCQQLCRFKAIRDFKVDPFKCEGCGLCLHACPCGAVNLKTEISGHWFVSDTKYGAMVHAELCAGQENSGRLVTKVKNTAGEIARRNGSRLVITDGPPGIGCPVISSLSGADAALIITEPTVSGIHDMERVLDLCNFFGIKTLVVINKYDLNLNKSEAIAKVCRSRGIELAGRIPYDDDVTRCLTQKRVLVESSGGPAAEHVRTLWKSIKSL